MASVAGAGADTLKATMEDLGAASFSSRPVPLQPMTLEPVCVERIWGTEHLSPWHDDPQHGSKVGEIWLSAEDCKVQSGPYASQTLAQLTAAQPAAFGDPRGDGFPLLIKLLFPNEKLSVQVHPNDAQAQALHMPRGKTECWYVLSAEKDAQVAVGFREPLSPAEIAAAIKDGSIEEKLRMLPVKAGDMIFVDAGTVHAIGPGMVVLETQQYSDTTYRLWDYGRPRELHVDAGTAVTRTQTAAGLVTPQPMEGFSRLVSCPYFAVDRFSISQGSDLSLGAADHLQILIALHDGCELRSADRGQATPLARGRAVVIPATGVPYALSASNTAEVIRVLQP